MEKRNSLKQLVVARKGKYLGKRVAKPVDKGRFCDNKNEKLSQVPAHQSS